MRILTKILANCMAYFISLYIHKNQVGFIPGRQGPDQRGGAIDIISLLLSGWDGGPNQKGMPLSDFQKAFDSVSWSYRFSLIHHWGFGQNFMGLLRDLYSSPEALIRLQGFYSEPI